MPALTDVQAELASLADLAHAETSKWFFKTGPGEYGENDQFRGIRVPKLRKTASKFKQLAFEDTLKLLKSPWHEDRMVALFILTHQFNKGDDTAKTQIFEAYLAHTAYINNWDLVDCSAHKIVGPYLMDRDAGILAELVQSSSLWERRIAMMSTYYFIKNLRYTETLHLAEALLEDKEDLIHKVVGWMLREMGKRDMEVEEAFLQRHYKRMPRTMLRYAIEKFPEERRQAYLKGTV